MARKIKLNFHGNSAGTHPPAWRPPYSRQPGEFSVSYYQELARIAERGLFDGFFFADILGMAEGRLRQPMFDPLVILTALASVTERIGLIGSASTTFSEPYNIARQYASLDHVSRGRAGWNVVTTFNETAAANFGLTHLPDKPERYARAEEFVDVVRKLWSGWDYASLQQSDGAGAVASDLQPPTRIDHSGRYYQVAGPLQVPRTPQQAPVIFQAGGSPEGRALAARTAEGVFASSQTLKEAQAFYADIKSRVVAAGRRAQDVTVMPGVYVYLAGTDAEARIIRDELVQEASTEKSVRQLAESLSVPVSDLHMDQPIPECILEHALKMARRSTINSVIALAREGRPTVRQILARRPLPAHRVLIDVPERIADSLQEWFIAGAADGFNVGNLTPAKLEDFVDQVIPLLQRRGLYRTEYQGDTLRSHYQEGFESA